MPGQFLTSPGSQGHLSCSLCCRPLFWLPPASQCCCIPIPLPQQSLLAASLRSTQMFLGVSPSLRRATYAGLKLGAQIAASAATDLPLLFVQVAHALLCSVPAGGNAAELQSTKIKQKTPRKLLMQSYFLQREGYSIFVLSTIKMKCYRKTWSSFYV